jgi:cytochrome c biogenesis protein CcdA
VAEPVSLLQLALSLVAGALSTLSPCVFPLLPVVIGAVAHTHDRIGPIAMGAGMVAAFVALGTLLGALGPALGVDAGHVRIVAGVLLVAMALVMLLPDLGERTPAWLSGIASAAQRLSQRLHPETVSGAFLLGGLLGLVWTPCSGPLLGSAIALVATEGGLILGLFGLGAAAPLIAAAYLSRALFMRLRRWVLGHASELRHGFAVLIALMGLAVLTGLDRRLEAFLIEILPDAWLALTSRF